MFKRISALFIVVIMALTVSCAGEPAELLAFIDSNDSGEIDLEGKTFSFASSWHSEWYAFPDEALPTASVERMMERFHSIEQIYNAEFEMLQMTEDDVTMLLITGEDTPEMFDTTAAVAYDLYKSNALASLNQLSAIDTSNMKWGATNFIQYGNFDGEQYGFYPWHWEFIPQFEGAVLFNAELIAKFGGTHPYELQESGDWNWNNFESELKTYSVTENETQYYGVIAGDDQMAKAAILSNGGKIIEGDSETGYTYGLTSEKSVQALDWLKGLKSEKLWTDGGCTDFTKQQIAPYHVGPSYYGTVFNPNDETSVDFAPSALNDYGFITFPTGPQGTETDVGAFVYRSRRLNYISDISDIESEYIAHIVNYIFEPLEDSAEEGWKDYVKNLIFTENNNDKCFENFNFIIENMGYDYSVQMGSFCYDNLNRAFSRIINGTSTIAEALGSIESQIMEGINK